MNRTKRPMTAAARKKGNKAIKKAEKEFPKPETVLRSDTLKASKEVKKYPKKTGKEDASLLKALKKNIAVKKTKAKAVHSKRTTPGSVEGQPSAPAYPNKEGARWAKTLVKQTQAKRKVMTKKASKQK